MKDQEKRMLLCERLQRLGYTRQRRIKLYGEEFDLISNPTPDGNGYVIDGVSCKSGGSRQIRIPLSLVHTIEHELLAMGDEVLAA